MDFLLKQRLVGAVVLVALGVIFIPMLLEGPEQPVVPPLSDMPAPANLPEPGRLGEFPAPEEVAPEPPQAVLDDAGDSKVPSSAPVPVTPDANPPASDAGAGADVKPLQSWVVQVGSFSGRENALALRQRLRTAGFATQVEKVVLENGTTYRVRVGPFLQRAQADDAQRRLQGEFQLAGRVMRYP